ncbi:MAG TPA: hypothetical protein VES65_11270 [Solirubrobacteraceae bacterium]|nr:hypothetical protein [Solirubrobacteraceae bacterium]
MVPRVVKGRSSAACAAIACAAIAVLAGCGSSARSKSSARAGANPLAGQATPGGCAATVLATLGKVAMRVYHEGVAGERTGSALYSIAHSIPLREAVEHDDPAAAQAAARALVATGHMTNLKVMRGAQTLADAGGPNALAPLRGSVLDASGSPVASFLASVWADEGFVAETDGIAEGMTALRQNGRSIAGSFALPSGELPAQGALTVKGVRYRYTSFPAAVFPAGRLQVYVLKPASSIHKLCGPTARDTVVNTASRVASLIYAGEAGRRTLPQIRRVQRNRALLRAVARRDPEATRKAIEALLNQHIVRLRVSAGARLLSDVGGPYVLAPVRAPLRLNGRSIGSFVLSIQDDLGYQLLAQRLAGLKVVMHRGSQLVMSSLHPVPAHVPASGPFRYGGHDYNVFTLHAQAFPSGPLQITVLIPIPYS